MKKIIAIMLSLVLTFASFLSVSAKMEYDYSGDLPEDNPAHFWPYTIDQRATRYSPWFVQWARQTKSEAEAGNRGGDGNQVLCAIGVSPVNKDHVCIGSDMAGIWRSTDGGINWETMGGNNNCWTCSDIQWSPTDENVVFAVQTGHRDAGSASATKAHNSDIDGLYKSTDAGKTWKQVLNKDFISGGSSNGLVQFDQENNLVYALSSEGLFVSKDDGESFEVVSEKFMPEDTGVYGLYLFKGGRRMLACGQGGLYYSSNGGLLWKLKNGNLPGAPSECTSVTVDPTDENHWIACFQGVTIDNVPKTLFQTYDAGETWESMYYRVNASGLARTYFTRLIQKDDGTLRLVISYKNCGNPWQYSDDMGKSWTVPPLVRPQIYNHTGGYMEEGTAICASDPSLIFYSFGDCVYKSTDYGTTFNWSNGGYSGINTNQICFDSENRIYFADVDRGLAVTDEPYKPGYYPTATRLGPQGASTAVCVDPNDDNHIFAYMTSSVLMESKDKGATWTETGVSGSSGIKYIIKYDPRDSKKIYTSCANSYDGGLTWVTNEYPITDICASNYDVWYSYKDSTIYRTKDAGKTWTEVTKPSTPYAIMADKFDEDTVWYGGYSGAVSKCTGTTVTSFNASNGLKCAKGVMVSITAIEQDPKDKNHLIVGGKCTYGGAKSPGLYETYDGGNSWMLVPESKGTMILNSITFSPISDEVFVGTCSNGFLIYDYKTFKKWYDGEITTFSKDDEYIIPTMYKDGRIRVKIDDDVIGFDVDPYLSANDRTLVPMRKIFEVLGAKIEWDDATETVTATKGNDVIKLTIGKNSAYINGEEKELQEPAQVTNDRTMVPLRFVAEALGCKVDWNDPNNLVIIKSK